MSRWRTSGWVMALGMLMASAAPAQAQQRTGSTVAGSVVDESGAILPGANVQIQGPGVNRFQTTGPEGTYTFTVVPAGTYKVTANLGGFGSGTRDVTVGGTDAVQVPPLTLKLAVRGEEVVVTATKTETSLINAPATMSVISEEKILASPAQNYGDLLRSVPGLNVIQMSARDININSRQASGTLSASQLVVLDGRSIYLDFYGFTLWDWIPSNPQDIKQIEIVRGPASAVWGANALTGVVNIITKTPRENQGVNLTLTGGLFSRDAGSTAGQGSGQNGGVGASYAHAANDTWSYKLSAGYFFSDPFPRPAGTIPRTTHPLDASIATGGAAYPADRQAVSQGERAFQNTSTSQPKVDLRVDQDLSSGGRITYAGGYAGTEGLIHTGIGPFDIQSGSHMSYGKVGYFKGAFKANAFVNLVDADAPSLLLPDPQGNPVNLTFKTQTYDFELGHSSVLGGNNILTYGGNARRNNFDTSLTPNSKDRNEFGAYVQDELFFGRFRFALGGRVDKFGNIEDPVFSPRLMVMFKPLATHSLRASYNRAFQSPSVVNNYLNQPIIGRVLDFRALAPALPLLGAAGPVIQPIVTRPFPLIVNNIGNANLKEQSIDAFELAYTGNFGAKTTVGIALYTNKTNDSINFVSLVDNPTFPGFTLYSAQDPPPGMTGTQLTILSQLLRAVGQPALALPKNGATYLNLGPIRNRGLELSLDQSLTNAWSAFVNYSYQDDPKALSPDSGQLPYPTSEINVPPTNRFNVGLNFNNRRVTGSVSVNYADKAFWTDVLDLTFAGFTDGYTMVNASVGVKWAGGKVTTSLKGTNLGNEDIQQHVFGDIMKRTIIGEVRFRF
jgi:outer membrane receptor for ferrienterochelin and colicins